jgi:hypothetical protein
MCHHCLHAAVKDSQIGRRSILKLAAALAAGLVTASYASAAYAKAPPKPENVLAPDAVRAAKRCAYGVIASRRTLLRRRRGSRREGL